MIEPDHFTRHRMPRHCSARLPRPQTIPTPFGFNTGFATVSLDLRSVVSLKHRLPRQRKTVPKIPDQHPAFFREPSPDRRVDTFQDFAAVRNRRLSTLGRRCLTEEEDLQRPGMLI